MPRPQSHSEREQFWRRHLIQQRSSGLSIREYCRRQGFSEPSFYSWRKSLLEHDQTPTTPATPAFLPVTVADTPIQSHKSPIDIQLANGCRIRIRSGCDCGLLADVLALLHASTRPEARPC